MYLPPPPPPPPHCTRFVQSWTFNMEYMHLALYKIAS